MNAFHLYLADHGLLPAGAHGRAILRKGDWIITACDCGNSDERAGEALSTWFTAEEAVSAIVDAMNGKYLALAFEPDNDSAESSPCDLGNMVFDLIAEMEDFGDKDYRAMLTALAENLKKEIDDILGWREHLAISGGGAVYVRVPDYIANKVFPK